MITLIAAVAKNGVIGINGEIPWYLPEDFKHFSSTTKGHVVIMGSQTWASLPARFRPLPHRHNIVVSRTERVADDASSIEEALNKARAMSGQGFGDEIFVIGGASIYEQTIDIADRLLISEVALTPPGDTFFPKIGEEWTVLSRDSREGFTILDYRRVLT